ncbi:MAG TPA: hypothetical protein VMS11_13215 [Solirubrobacterales bacterium]|nr:hypothetical protein [Solirubrobacterales bacterium]
MRRCRPRIRWALGSLLLLVLVAPSSAAGFEVEAFTVTAREANGTIDERAASHPFALDVHLAMDLEPSEELHTVQVDLPPGLAGNALAVPRCPLSAFEQAVESCLGSTQVGVLRGIATGLGQVEAPVFNLEPSPGEAAAFGASVDGETFVLGLVMGGTGSSSSIRLSGTVPPDLRLVDVEEEIWGIPADPAHDAERVCPAPGESQVVGCSAEVSERALLTLPAACADPLRATLTARSLGPPALAVQATSLSRDAAGNPHPLVGCERIPFDPRLMVRTEAAPLSPTALSVDLELAQYEALGLTPAAPLAALRVELPGGMALNPSSGSWLSGCSPAAIGLATASGVEPPRFDDGRAACPGSSRLGTATLRTPLIDHELSGAIYLAAPGANPFGSRYAIYLVIDDEATGTIRKIPGRLDADQTDGRLTAIIPELPRFPFSELDLELSGGPQAPLVSPPSCGRYSTAATFTPSTAPFAPAVTRTSGFTLSAGAFGAPCPAPEVDRNAAPSFEAGTESTRAGGDSPLVIDLSRSDLDQHFGSFDLTLPPGLVADLGSVPVGATVGSVRVGAGLGPQPLALGGAVYLGGPYKGSPYSLEIVVPAKVGPFDLGTIVQRAAVSVDPETAQVSVSSDPLPRILGGVPLELRSLRLDLDRPGFVRNPSSCEPMRITGSATTSLGVTTPLSQRFQVGDCAALPFAPKLSLRASGALGRNGHPAMRAVVRGERGEATLARLGFTLPAGELLDLRHLRVLCPRGVAAADCPRDSRLGNLRLESPFLDGALEGAVYLRRPGGKLPDLVAELRSAHLRLLLHGRTMNRHGGFGLSFGSLPDIPLSRAVLALFGGRRGIVVNSRSLCTRPGIATATAAAHSGKHRQLRVPLRPAGC